MRKSVLVTGSSRGIGKAIALRLARDEYDIALHCRSRRDAADSVAQSIVALGRQARVLLLASVLYLPILFALMVFNR